MLGKEECRIGRGRTRCEVRCVVEGGLTMQGLAVVLVGHEVRFERRRLDRLAEEGSVTVLHIKNKLVGKKNDGSL